jgi:hypothetical protein
VQLRQIPKGLEPSTFGSTGRCSGDVKDCITGTRENAKYHAAIYSTKNVQKKANLQAVVNAWPELSDHQVFLSRQKT